MANGNVSHQLSIVIGAALGSGFNSAISGSTSKIGQICAAIKDMEKNSSLSKKSLENLSSKYNSFLASMNQQQRILQKRSFYRSQIMDMVALGAALVAPVKSAMEFNSQLSKLKRIFNFSDSDGHKKFGAALTEMSLRIPVTVNDLGKLAVAGGRFGVSLQDLPGYVENVAKASKVWGMDAEETGEKIGSFMKTFSIKPSGITKNFDLITRLGRDTGKTGDQVLNAMITAGSGLSLMKLPIDQVAAMTSTLMGFGESSEQAGSAINIMFQKLSGKASAGAQIALQKIGLSAKILPHMVANHPEKVLDKLFSGLSKLSGLQRSNALLQIFGRRAAGTVGKLIENLGTYRENLNKARNADGYFEKDWESIARGTSSSITRLTNTFSVFGREIGMSLLPTIKRLCNSLSDALKPAMDFMNRNKELTSTVVHTAAGFISLRIATFALGYASTFLFGGLNKLVLIFKGLRLGLALLGSSFRSFFRVGPLALVGAAWMIIENWEAVRSFLVNIWNSVEPHWLKFRAIIDEYGITDKIVTGWNAVQSFFGSIWEIAKPHWLSFKAILDQYGIADHIVAGWSSVQSLFSNIWETARSHWLSFKAIIDEFGITDNITFAWNSVRSFFSNIWGGVIVHWDSFINKIQSINIADKIMASWTKLKEFFTGIWSSVLPQLEAFSNLTSKIWNGIKSPISAVGNLFSSNEDKASLTSKLPPMMSSNAAPITKNQNTNVVVNVNASKITDSKEVAKHVSREMKSFNWSYLYDPIGELP